MLPFTLSLILHEHGIAEAVMSSREQNLRVFPSYLSDAPALLVDAALSVLRSPTMDIATCSWQDEPGEWRWLLRCEGDNVRIDVLRFKDSFSRLPDERGERVFMAHCSLLRLATRVKGQIHRLLNEHGEQGYADRWRHPFPM